MFSEESETIHYSLTAFHFVGEDEVVVEELLNIDLHVGQYAPAIDMRGEVVCILFYGQDGTIGLVLLDVQDGRPLFIKTTLSYLEVSSVYSR